MSDSDEEEEPVRKHVFKTKETSLKDITLCVKNKPSEYPNMSSEPTKYFEGILTATDADPSHKLYTGPTFELTRADLLMSVFSESFLRRNYVKFSALRKAQKVYEWANDTMIDSYMSLLNRYDKQKLFFTFARFGNFVFNKERFAEKWKRDYKCAQFMLFPINVGGNHWTFAYADATDANNKVFAYVDTLKRTPDITLTYGNTKKPINVLDEVIKFWCMVKNEDKETVESTWKTKINEFPRQPDNVSCGFFVCEFAKYAMLKWEPPSNMTDQYVGTMRKNIAYEILTNNIIC